MMGHTCDPRIEEMEATKSGVQDQSQEYNESEGCDYDRIY